MQCSNIRRSSLTDHVKLSNYTDTGNSTKFQGAGDGQKKKKNKKKIEPSIGELSQAQLCQQSQDQQPPAGHSVALATENIKAFKSEIKRDEYKFK